MTYAAMFELSAPLKLIYKCVDIFEMWKVGFFAAVEDALNQRKSVHFFDIAVSISGSNFFNCWIKF